MSDQIETETYINEFINDRNHIQGVLPSEFRELYSILAEIAKDDIGCEASLSEINDAVNNRCPNLIGKLTDDEMYEAYEVVNFDVTAADSLMDVFFPKSDQRTSFGGQLPVDMRPSKEAFEELGFRFEEICREDPIFIKAMLPEGWKLIRGENVQYYKNVVDESGQVRVSIFEKFAQYDRRAHMSIVNAD